MEFTRRGGQHGMDGLPPGGLHRSLGHEVAVERSGKLPRYKPDCRHIKHPTSDIKSASGQIRRGEHRRVCGL